MYKQTKFLVAFALVTLSAGVVTACSNDDATPVNSARGINPLDPSTPDAGSNGGAQPTVDGGPNSGTNGSCSNKPSGCFCGTPTTQKEFLNRCTNAAALTVKLTPKAATTADVP